MTRKNPFGIIGETPTDWSVGKEERKMEETMSKFSVKKPMTILVAVVIILILAFVSFTKMKTDLLPDMNLPYAMVMTTYIGASPEEVEMVVTKPVEQAMATITNIKNVSSISNENYSMVIMEFSNDVNMDTATIDIRESLDQIVAGWDDDKIGAPIMMKLNPDMMPVLVAAIDSDEKESIELSKFVEDVLMPKLESVEGVASVTVNGLVEEKVQVVLRQEKIDKVNKKIQKAVKEQLEDAKSEMESKKEEVDSGLEEILSGKNELDGKKNDMNQGMLTASQQLTNARMELLKKELELTEGKKTLISKKEQAEQQLRELLAKESELLQGDLELSKKEEEVETAQKALEEGKKEIEKYKKTLQDGRTQLELAKTYLENNLTLGETEKEAAQIELDKKFAELETGEKQLEEKETLLKEQAALLEAGLPELTAARKELDQAKTQFYAGKRQLESGVTQINQALSQMEEGEAALESGKQELEQKEAELNNQKITAQDGLTEAEITLKDTEKQLQEGQKLLEEQLGQFDQTKEDALEAADLNKTLTIDMITNLLMAQNFSMPAGYITEGEDEYLVRVGDKLQDVDSVSKMVLFDPNIKGIDPINLGEVADVFLLNNADEMYAKVNGNNAITFSFEKQNSYATAEVSEAVKARLQEISAEYSDLHVIYLMDQGMYIGIVVDSVLNNLIYGAILSILILIFFLKDIKPTFIVACSIPISVTFAIALMYFSGVTLNLISLSGLAVGVGMLVDNSIVVIENIYRLRQKGISPVKASVTGAVQVAGAITASTLTTVGVFLPIVFVEGMTKDLFMDMALTIGYSLVASLIVALTLIPMMASRMLKNTAEKKHPLMDRIILGYEKLLRVSLRLKPLVLLLAIALLIGSAYLAISNGTSFMPAMDSTQVNVSLKMPKDAKRSEKIAYADEVMKRIMTIEEIDSVGAMMGGNLMTGMMGGASSSENISMYVLLKEEKSRSSQEISKEIDELCSDLACEVDASGSNMDMSALGGSGISIRVYGNEIQSLQKIAKEVGALIESVEGTVDVSNGLEEPAPEISISIDKGKAIAKGLTVAQVYAAISAELADSKTATTLQYETMNYPVVVVEETEKKLTKETLENLKIPVTKQDGTKTSVALKKIASISEDSGLSSIRRSSNQRYLTVSAAIQDGYNIGLVSGEVEKALEGYEVPDGYRLQHEGENENINEAISELINMLLLAVAFIYLIMVAQFQSLLSPFIVMFTIPLAFTGGFLGLYFSGSEISVISMIGFVMVAGIIVNNGIVLVDYINQLRREGEEKKEAIIEAGKTRMRPILMTALTTVLGLSTMVMGVGMGAGMVQPIAIVAVGGLLFGTVTTLFVIPVIYDLLNRKELKVISEEELQVYEEL